MPEHPSSKKMSGQGIAGSSSQAATGGPKFSEEGKNVGNRQQDESYISRLMRRSKSIPIGMCNRSADSGECGKDCQNLKMELHKVMKENLILLNSDEDRVQGLLGVELNASKEDPISEDSQGGSCKG
jgi:hypothetical protein